MRFHKFSTTVYSLSFLLILLFTSGCNNQSDNNFGELSGQFPIADTLSGTEILQNQLGILHTSLVDSLFICITDSDTFFQIYNIEEKLISSFGQKGRGPNEFILPPLIEDVILRKNKTMLLLNDQINKQLLLVNLNKSIANGKLIINKRYKLPQTLFGLKHIFGMEDEFIGVYDSRNEIGPKGKTGACHYFPNMDSVSTASLFNVNLEPFRIVPAMNVNARLADFSANKKKMVVVMKRSPKIEILNFSDTLSLERYSSAPHTDIDTLNTFKLEAYQSKELTLYYQYLQITDQYIYLLYSGYQENRSKEQKIRVIDWNGNKIAQYQIPDKYDLSSFEVDEAKEEFYGSSYANDAIYKFNY